MRIDEFGRFIYETGYESTYFEFPYSEKESIAMAKDILMSLGLWNTNYRHWSLGRTVIKEIYQHLNIEHINTIHVNPHYLTIT